MSSQLPSKVFFVGAVNMALIPAAWWLGDLLPSLINMPYVFPPTRIDWLKCLPHQLLNQANFNSEYWLLCQQKALALDVERGLYASSVSLGCSLTLMAGALAAKLFSEPPQRILLSGLQLYRGKKAAKTLAATFKKQIQTAEDNAGIRLTGSIAMPTRQELRQWLVCGAMGSGKTVIIRTLIERWNERGDKSLVLDIQGDFVASLQTTNAAGKRQAALLLNPFDTRSGEWVLGSDILNTEDARQFAQKFISASANDPFWAKASSNIMISVIKSLQHDLGQNWSWHRLSGRINAPITDLLDWSRLHYKPALRTLEKEGSETADSVLINFATDFAIVSDIAAYWHSGQTGRSFSIRKWLFENSCNQKLVILGWDASKKETSRAWAAAFIDLAGSIIASPTYTKRGRVNLILDEFSEFDTRMQGVLSAIERGRAKNVATVIGVQSPAQLRDVYKARADGFSSIIGNHIYVQTSPGKDAEDASQFLGMQTVKDREVSYSSSKNGTSKTVHWTERRVPVFSPADFSTKLGPHKKGVRVLYAGIGHDAYLLDFPYPSITNFRPQFVPAMPVATVARTATGKPPASPRGNSFSTLLKPKG